jgi:hypothetical protein
MTGLDLVALMCIRDGTVGQHPVYIQQKEFQTFRLGQAGFPDIAPFWGFLPASGLFKQGLGKFTVGRISGFPT